MAPELDATPLDRFLPNPLLVELQSKTTPAQRAWVIETLKGEYRWGKRDPEKKYPKPINYGDMSYLPMRPGFEETNLGHVQEMLGMSTEAEGYPGLKSTLDFRAIRIIIILHDLAEFRVGDAPFDGEERQKPIWQVRKSFEPRVVRSLIARLNDDEFRNEVEGFYTRYEKRSNSDPEAWFVKFLDIAQGAARSGARHVFDWKAGGLTAPNMRTILHVGKALEKMADAAEPFITSLPNEEARMDGGRFVFSEFQRLSEVGYNELVNPHVSHLERVLKT